MSITDELRKYAQSWRETPNLMDDLDAGDIDGLLGDIEHIADCIDAECEEAIQQALMGEGSVPATDENMAEHGWVRLPLDADGVPIRIGDVIAYKDNTKPKEVVALVPPSVVMVEDGPRYADMCRHYHEPTVEDVLLDLLEESSDPTCDATPTELAEKYAAKLRLAESEDA